MKYLLSCLYSFLIILSSTLPIYSEIDKNRTKKFSLEVGVGIAGGGILPFLQGKIAYRLPIFEEKLVIFLGYAIGLPIVEITTRYAVHMPIIGAKYYFINHDLFQPYANLGTGLNITNGVYLDSVPLGQDPYFVEISPILFAGIGNDFMFLDNFGISLQFNVVITNKFVDYFRPELNLKLAF